MTLDDFRTEEQKRLELFMRWWEVKSQAEPEIFPMDMEPGEWDEQFHFFDPEDARRDLEAVSDAEATPET